MERCEKCAHADWRHAPFGVVIVMDTGNCRAPIQKHGWPKSAELRRHTIHRCDGNGCPAFQSLDASDAAAADQGGAV